MLQIVEYSITSMVDVVGGIAASIKDSSIVVFESRITGIQSNNSRSKALDHVHDLVFVTIVVNILVVNLGTWIPIGFGSALVCRRRIHVWIAVFMVNLQENWTFYSYLQCF